MAAILLEGRQLAATLRAEIAREVGRLKERGRQISLAAIQVGHKPESVLDVKNQQKVCLEVGMDFHLEELPDTVSQAGLHHAIEEFNRNPAVQGIILQLPLPARLDARLAQRMLDRGKDAEG